MLTINFNNKWVYILCQCIFLYNSTHNEITGIQNVVIYSYLISDLSTIQVYSKDYSYFSLSSCVFHFLLSFLFIGKRLYG